MTEKHGTLIEGHAWAVVWGKDGWQLLSPPGALVNLRPVGKIPDEAAMLLGAALKLFSDETFRQSCAAFVRNRPAR